MILDSYHYDCTCSSSAARLTVNGGVSPVERSRGLLSEVFCLILNVSVREPYIATAHLPVRFSPQGNRSGASVSVGAPIHSRMQNAVGGAFTANNGVWRGVKTDTGVRRGGGEPDTRDRHTNLTKYHLKRQNQPHPPRSRASGQTTPEPRNTRAATNLQQTTAHHSPEQASSAVVVTLMANARTCT